MRTASLINDTYNRMTINAPEPVVGMGATLTSWTDRHPATVIQWDGKIIAVQEDDYCRTDGNGMSEAQEYEYTPNSNRPVRYFRRDKTNAWLPIFKNQETGRWNTAKYGGGLILGFRDKYHDFSF